MNNLVDWDCEIYRLHPVNEPDPPTRALFMKISHLIVRVQS